MNNDVSCPSCNSNNIKKNGCIHNGKQNHFCKDCGRQFVLNPTNKIISEKQRELVKKMLLERVPLRGICRVTDCSLTWLLQFISDTYSDLPDDLNFQPGTPENNVIIYRLKVGADEMWSFVGNKDNKQWIWIAIDAKIKQVLAFYVGDRSKDSAKKLWDKIPEMYKKKAIFYTDLYESYHGVIPKEQHRAVIKQSGKTNHIERLNCTIRQRVSRLVRSSLSFSKKLDNHIGAIKYFLCNYNLEKAAALPE